jgi:hypothetical protein
MSPTVNDKKSVSVNNNEVLKRKDVPKQNNFQKDFCPIDTKEDTQTRENKKEDKGKFQSELRL